MAEKQYPQMELRKVALTTTIPCAACGAHNKINEVVFFNDATNTLYHLKCAPIGSKSKTKETYVHELTINEGKIPIKSE